MDGECAFCGRNGAAAHLVFCVDCQQSHAACQACLDDLASQPDTYRLVA